MYMLSVAVIVLAVLVLLDLSLTAAVIRRLRLLSERFSPPGAAGLPVGAEVPAFQVTAADGSVLTSDVFAARRTLVAFYSPSCTGCREQAPEFVEEAGRLTASGTPVLPVLVTNGAERDGDDPGGLRELLARAGRLVVDGEGVLARAFAVGATPSYFTVGPDGRIAGKGLRVAESLASDRS